MSRMTLWQKWQFFVRNPWWKAGCLLILLAIALPARADLQVVTSIPPLAAMIREIHFNPDAVSSILPPGSNPHSFEPAPSQIRKVQGADVLVVVGLGFDPWMTRLIAVAGHSPDQVIVASEGLSLVPLEGHDHDHEGENEAMDPHFWLDPDRVILVAENITRKLIELDPAHQAEYRSRLERWKKELEVADRQWQERFRPYRGMSLAATHSGWAYFAGHYGLRQAVVLQTAPGREPGPQTMMRLLQTTTQEKVRVVVSDPRFPDGSARVLAEETKIPIVRLRVMGAGESSETYLALMRWNVDTLLQALEASVK